MSVVAPNHNHQQLHQDLASLMAKHCGKMSAQEFLAIAAQVVGQVVAMQDQDAMTPEVAMALILRNIEMGNANATSMLTQTKGNA